MSNGSDPPPPPCDPDCDGPCVIITGGETIARATCFVQVWSELARKGTPVPQDWMDKYEHKLEKANHWLEPIYDQVINNAPPAIYEALELKYRAALLYEARQYGVVVTDEQMLALGAAIKQVNEFMAEANQKVAHRQPLT